MRGLSFDNVIKISKDRYVVLNLFAGCLLVLGFLKHYLIVFGFHRDAILLRWWRRVQEVIHLIIHETFLFTGAQRNVRLAQGEEGALPTPHHFVKMTYTSSPQVCIRDPFDACEMSPSPVFAVSFVLGGRVVCFSCSALPYVGVGRLVAIDGLIIFG